MSLLTFLGPPGSGKGEQCARLVALGWSSISTGQLLRKASSLETPQALAIRDLLNAGALIKDEIVLDLLLQELKNIESDKIILDGFPRTLDQLNAMVALNLLPNHVFVLEISDDEIVERLSGRLFDVDSGRVYHSIYNPPKESMIDDISKRPLVRRHDDEPDIIRKRLAIYRSELSLMLDCYRKYQSYNNFNIVFVDASASIDEVHKYICSYL